MAHFYAEPEVCAYVWAHLDIEDDLGAPDDKIAKPSHLLWCLLLLMTYEMEAVLSGNCKGIDEDTFRKWAWHFIEKVSFLEHEVVSCTLGAGMTLQCLFLTVLCLIHSCHSDCL